MNSKYGYLEEFSVIYLHVEFCTCNLLKNQNYFSFLVAFSVIKNKLYNKGDESLTSLSQWSTYHALVYL